MASHPLTYAHPYNAPIIQQVQAYLAESGRSARWLGDVIAGNPRLMDDLDQGHTLPWDTEIALIEHMDAFYDAAIAHHAAEIVRLGGPVVAL